MTRHGLALGADAERARMRAADRGRAAWRRWMPVAASGACLAIEDGDSALRVSITIRPVPAGVTSEGAWHRVATPTASFVQVSAGGSDVSSGMDGLVAVTATAAKRSPEDVVMRVDVTNGGFATTIMEVAAGLAFADTDPASECVDGRRPNVRAPWEAHEYALPPGTHLLLARHPDGGTWWLTGTADGLDMDAFDDDTSATLRVGMALEPGESRSVRLRLCRGDTPRSPRDLDAAATLGTRAREASTFGATLLPAAADDAQVRASLESLADVLWPSRQSGTTTDRICAAVGLAVADPVAGQARLATIISDAAQHPGTAAAPPILPWALLRVHELTAAAVEHRDHEFLEAAFQVLLDDYARWVDRVDAEGRNLLQGGILGLDGSSDTAEGTAWMACYTVWMLSLAIELARHDAAYQDVAVTFLDSALAMTAALDDLGASGTGLWDEAAGCYQDVALDLNGRVRRVPDAPLVGLLPLLAVAVIPRAALAHLPEVAVRLGWSLRHGLDPAGSVVRAPRRAGTAGDVLVVVASASRRERAVAGLVARTGDVSPVIAGLLLDTFDRLGAFDADLVAPDDLQVALLARLGDARGPAWANLLAGALRRSR